MSAIDRRTFLAALPAGVAVGPLLGVPASSAAARVAAPATADRLDVSLRPLDAVRREQLRAALGPDVTAQINWSWREVAGAAWPGDNVQQHVRYTASPEGAALAGPAMCRPAAAQECDPRGGRLAHAFELLPQAVIVHRAKAAAQGVRELTLSGFAARGLRPQFCVNSNGSAPENSWLLPLFTGTLGLAALDDPERLLTAHGEQALTRMIDARLARLSLRVLHRPMNAGDLAPLLDTGNPLLALYGAPALLHEAGADGSLAVISLQDFMPTAAPSLFAASMLQAGRSLRHAALAPLLRQLLAPDAGLAGAPVNGTRALLASHDAGYYRRLTQLEQLSDGGLLARLVIDIDAALQSGTGTSRAIARHAGARAVTAFA